MISDDELKAKVNSFVAYARARPWVTHGIVLILGVILGLLL